MSCDLCNCDDHPNKPCANCLNCIGHYQHDADWYETHHTELQDDSGSVGVKPHYVYDARTGVIHPKNPPAQKITE